MPVSGLDNLFTTTERLAIAGFFLLLRMVNAKRNNRQTNEIIIAECLRMLIGKIDGVQVACLKTNMKTRVI